MGYLGRRIGKSQDTATDSGSGGGGGLLDLWSNGYFQRQGNIYNAPGVLLQNGLTATGGVISDYTDGPAVYRAHIFTSLGEFEITAGGDFGDTVDILAIGGGGAGGRVSTTNSPWTTGAGGGGAGAVRYSTSVATPGSFPAPYTIQVGGGGAITASNTPSSFSSAGTPSYFGTPFTAPGGGGGANRANTPIGPGGPGGSGGGGAYNPTGSGSNKGPGTGATGHPGGTDIASPSPSHGWGNPGGDGSPSQYGGAGGGGAAAAGTDSSSNSGAAGGNGVTYTITGTSTVYAGGGGGGAGFPGGSGASGGTGGAGDGGDLGSPGTNGTTSTGSGGGGGACNPVVDGGPFPSNGQGGSGIVVVRYQIGELTAETKATGGAVSYYNNKTIHTFTSSGTFTSKGGDITDCEYLLIGGGGGGGAGAVNGYGGGGGGAGQFLAFGPVTIPAPAKPVVIGAGGRAWNIGQPSNIPAPLYQQKGGEPTTFNGQVAGGGGAGSVTPVKKDTSLDPIKSKYPLTEEQKKENERRRKKKIKKEKPASLIGADRGGDGGDMGGGGLGASSGGLGGIGDASGGSARV